MMRLGRIVLQGAAARYWFGQSVNHLYDTNSTYIYMYDEVLVRKAPSSGHRQKLRQ